jgi:two-component system, OmpR family, phosphate regulon sensor histidine kinase PhoR
MQVVSHDLRSPLGGIKGLAEIMLDTSENLSQSDIGDYAKIIVSTSDMLLDLINDLLDLAKIESGKMSVNLTNFNIIETIANCIELAKILAEKKGVTLTVDVPEDKTLMVWADEPKITQVINNLLSNALKFTPRSGKVHLNCVVNANDPQVVEISVVDTGIGIPDDIVPRLFEKFGKHQRMGTEGERGTGLGLPIVKRFVDLHSGHTSIESSVGKGTTFTISLPVLREHKEEPAVKEVLAGS